MISVRNTYFVYEEGKWRHRFRQGEYDLFMLDTSYEEFARALWDLRVVFPKSGLLPTVNVSSEYYIDTLRGPGDRCEDEMCPAMPAPQDRAGRRSLYEQGDVREEVGTPVLSYWPLGGSPLSPRSPLYGRGVWICGRDTRVFSRVYGVSPRGCCDILVTEVTEVAGMPHMAVLTPGGLSENTCEGVGICRGFLRSVYGVVYRSPVDRYRAPRQVSTVYRPPMNVEFCRSFILYAVPAVGAVDTLTTFTGTSALCRLTKVVAKSFREGELIMEVLSSRVLVRPTDFERSFQFYAENLGLPVYREWGRGSTRGVVFFLGGGFLELSGSSRTEASESVGLWLQVRDVDTVGHELKGAGVDIIELPTDKPWELREMQIRDPDGLSVVIVEVPESHPLRRR